jgi:outer membrane protein assembly factor BamB
MNIHPKNPISRCSVIFLCTIFALTHSALANDNWTSYRGPTDQGHTDAKNLALHWSESENVAWKIKLPGRGHSTPVIWGDRIWLTTATEDGKELSVLCIDKNTGKTLIEKLLYKVEKPQTFHPMNSYASPSPVIEEGRVYVTFGSPYTACLDSQTGDVLWERTDIVCNFVVGPASSPILYQNLLISHYDGVDAQFVMAFDKQTGKTVWKTDRTVNFDDIDPKTEKPKEDGLYRKAYSTPLVVEIGGKPTLFSFGSMAAYGYDPLTGKELWRIDSIGSYTSVMRPVTQDGIVYSRSGCLEGLWAMKLEGSEGVLDKKNVVLWEYKNPVPFLSSVLLVDGRIFMVADNGVAVCLNAKNGKQLWKERIEGDHAASPICADGKIYFFNQNGNATVVEAGPKYKILAENKLDEGMYASPAVSGDALYLRTTHSLYCIKNK